MLALFVVVCDRPEEKEIKAEQCLPSHVVNLLRNYYNGYTDDWHDNDREDGDDYDDYEDNYEYYKDKDADYTEYDDTYDVNEVCR